MAGFRLNPEEDADIIKDLARFKNRTKRIKEAYRKCMFLEAGTLASILEAPELKKPQSWTIPEEPSVKPLPPKGSVKANILFKNNFK